MNINQAIKLLKNGECVKRTAWGHANLAYLELEMFNNKLNVYIVGEHDLAPNLKTVYKFTFADLEAQDWVADKKFMTNSY
jgi:hypothetical protein